MILQKQKRIWERLEFVQNPKDMQKYVGKMLYLLFDSATMIGSTKIADMNAYLSEEDILETCSNDPSELTLLYGVVLDVKALPLELPDGLPHEQSLYVVRMDDYNSAEHEIVDSIEEAIEYIEAGVADSDGVSEIEDFGLIFGVELSFKLQVVPSTFAASPQLREQLGVG
jgi:hypothetical protein